MKAERLRQVAKWPEKGENATAALMGISCLMTTSSYLRWTTLTILLLGAGPAADDVDVPPPPEGFEVRGDAEAGKAVYLKKCALCHGENGDGKGRIKLDPPARDLRDEERMDKRTDWEIYLVIRDGGKALGLSEKMLPWGDLVSEQELHDLTAFIRTLSREDGGGATR